MGGWDKLLKKSWLWSDFWWGGGGKLSFVDFGEILELVDKIGCQEGNVGVGWEREMLKNGREGVDGSDELVCRVRTGEV